MFQSKLLCYILLCGIIFIFGYVAYQGQTETRSHGLGKNCPDGPIITVNLKGNLGNNIWEYMSLLAIDKLYGNYFKFSAYVPYNLKSKIEYIFESANLPVLPPNCDSVYHKQILKLNESILSCLKKYNNNSMILLDNYSARYEEIILYGIDNFKNILRFKKKYQDSTDKMLRNFAKKFNLTKNVTYVGMHYRGNDYLDLLHSIYSKFTSPPTYKFYKKAMDYFVKTYGNVVFLLITIDSVWLKDNYRHLNEYNLIVNPNPLDIIKDLSLLSNCNHSVISYGTFGTTAAIFSQGITFVYNLKVPIDHRGPTVAMGLADLLPNWHVLE